MGSNKNWWVVSNPLSMSKGQVKPWIHHTVWRDIQKARGTQHKKVCQNEEILNQPHILSLLGGWKIPQPCLKVPCSHCWMYYGLVQSLAKGRPHCCGSTFLGIVQYCVFRYCKGRSGTDHGYNTRWCGWILRGIFWKVSVAVPNLWGWGTAENYTLPWCFATHGAN